MKEQKKLTEQNGITLISLVITIVIMLILAGVAISIVIDENGLVDRSNEAKTKWSESITNESIAMQNTLELLNSIGGGNIKAPQIIIKPSLVEVEEGEQFSVLIYVTNVDEPTSNLIVREDNECIKFMRSQGVNLSTTNVYRAITAGTTTITATYGDLSETCTITVKPIPRISITPTTVEINGEAVELTATLSVAATQDIVWSSSDDTIATVVGSGTNNCKGTVKGVSVGGPVTITATHGDLSTTCTVTVKSMPKISVTPTTGVIAIDETVDLTATLNITPTQDIIWSSSDDTIATVVGSGTNNCKGTVTGVSAGGPVTITATYGDLSTTCTINVIEESIELVTFYIDGEPYQMPAEYIFYNWVNDPTYNAVNAYLDSEQCVRRPSDGAYLMSNTSPYYAVYGGEPAMSGHRYVWGTNPTFVQ